MCGFLAVAERQSKRIRGLIRFLSVSHIGKFTLSVQGRVSPCTLRVGSADVKTAGGSASGCFKYVQGRKEETACGDAQENPSCPVYRAARRGSGNVEIHEDKMADTSAHHKQMEYFVRSEILMFSVKDREL